MLHRITFEPQAALALVLAVISSLASPSIGRSRSESGPGVVEPSVASIVAKLNDRMTTPEGTWQCSMQLADGAESRWGLSVASGGVSVRRTPRLEDGVYTDRVWYYEPSTRLRYSLAAVEVGARWEDPTHMLLVALQPELLLAGKQLSVSPPAASDDRDLVCLHANVAGDPIAAATPPARVRPGQVQLVEADFYFAPSRGALARVELLFDDGACLVFEVLDWHAASSRPRTVEVRRQSSAAGTTPRHVARVVVDSFSGGDVAEFASMQNEFRATPFFVGIPEDVRRPHFYRQLLTIDPSVTNRVCLAQSLFMTFQPNEGLESWIELEKQLPDATDRHALLRAMLRPAAESMSWIAVKDEKQAQACVQLLGRLLAAEITEAEWRTISRCVCLAWALLREKPEFAIEMERFDETVIRRAAHGGSHPALRVLIEYANRNAAMSAKIDPVLSELAAAELPVSGYANSQQSLLLGVVVQHNLWQRAREYSRVVNWHPDTPAPAKQAPMLLHAMIDQLDRTTDPQIGSALSDFYHRARDPNLDTDEFSRETCRSLAVKLGVAVLRARLQSSDVPTPAQLVTASDGKPDAAMYWDEVVTSLLKVKSSSEQGAAHLVSCSLALAQACENTFGDREYVANTYIRIGQSDVFNPRVHSPLEKIAFLRSGFDHATSDETRLRAIRAAVQVLCTLEKFSEAEALMSELGAKLQSEAGRSALAKLDRSIEDEAARQAVTQQAIEREREVERVKGQIDYLRTRISDARREGQAGGTPPSLQKALAAAQERLEQLKHER